ncbi:MAG: hypothetical protein CFE32_23580, partial [Alphaproteobacteria bacterium PA3]
MAGIATVNAAPFRNLRRLLLSMLMFLLIALLPGLFYFWSSANAGIIKPVSRHGQGNTGPGDQGHIAWRRAATHKERMSAPAA